MFLVFSYWPPQPCTRTLPSNVSGWCVAGKPMCAAGSQMCVAGLFSTFLVFVVFYELFEAVCPFLFQFKFYCHCDRSMLSAKLFINL